MEGGDAPADGLTCGACQEAMVDDEGKPRTTVAHHCKACRAPWHSAFMCESVWQPEEDGDETFCGKACVEAHNAKLTADQAEGVDEDEDEPLPAPELLPIRRRASKAEQRAEQRDEQAARRV